LAFAFAFLMGGAGVQDTLLSCRMESAVHRVCCCKHASSAQAATNSTNGNDEISRRPCCDEIAWQSAAIPPSSASAPLAFVAPSLLEHRMPVSMLVAAVERIDVARFAVDVRDATGPPIPIKHRALLI
jgi:hypothetical protein